MGDLTANLSAHEFACDCRYTNCTSKLAAHMPLAMALQAATDYFSREYNTVARINITDGNRCRPNNIDIQMKWAKKTREQAVKSKSKHLYHIAADHYIEVLVCGEWDRVPAEDLYSYYCAQFPDSCGVGLYVGRVHLDMRKVKGRWSA